MDPSSIPTAFPSLDKTLGGGLRTGDLIVLGGDAGSGTSSLSLAIALKAGVAGSLFLTSEMSSDRVAERALAMEARVMLSDIRLSTLSDEDQENVAAAKAAYKVYSQIRREKPNDKNYTVDHSSYMYLMDTEGEYIAHFPHDVPLDKLLEALNKNM